MILILGKNGMLGHRMLAHLQARFPEVVGVGREDGFNAEDRNSVMQLLQRLQPAVVVNCVAVIKQLARPPRR